MNNPLRLLSNLSPSEFLSDYWQKKPLLIRGAIPNFTGLLSPNDLAGLACEEDVQARIIQFKNNTWHMQNGPFNEHTFSALPDKNWTLLVQGVNHYVPEATELIAQFNFIPYARLDDLMVSYAPDGGGVGAHFDSYDVFLLQGSGKRKWQISAQADLSLVEGAPIKVLAHFVPEQEWILEAGDMLYLPPQIAHYGIAIGEDCMTYSIGFRAPKTQELAHEFLNYLQDQVQTLLPQDTLYADADLTLQNNPAEISPHMALKVSQMLEKLHWHEHTIGDFLGRYLTEPKAHVTFQPHKKITLNTFKKLALNKTLHLNLQSQLLFWQNSFYLNGEVITVNQDLIHCMQILANTRYINMQSLPEAQMISLCETLLPYYLAGYLIFMED